ncbi:MAG TPA: hypothetical protein VN830_07185 [Verrucomicrobiae bacterium]|nr:hypothetical protein [Verrucomicrobiae bacterium]
MAVLITLSATAGAAAQSWQRLGPEGGMVMSLAAAPGGRLYLGTADGHVFVSEDGVGRWELRGRVSGRTDAVISRLVADPLKPDRVYAAAWYQEPGKGGGVFRSEDAGRTWSPYGLAEEEVRALEIAPGQPDVLVAGTRSGVYRSREAGKNWERISPARDAELKNVDSIAVDPADANIIYVGTFHLPWKTTDGGKTWSSIAAGLIDDSDIMSLRVDAMNPSRVYLSACSGIYRSENQGGVWTKLQGIPYAARRTQQIVQDARHSQTLYAATTEGLWVTRDAGENWKRTTPKDWVVTSVVLLPGIGDVAGKVVLATEGQGVLTSEDGGENFVPANAGFRHLVVKQLVGDTWQDPRHLLLVTEEGGERIWESRDAGKSWAPAEFAAEGPGKTLILHPEMIQRIYPSPWGWLVRLNNGQVWLCDASKGRWNEWKFALASGITDQAQGKRTKNRSALGMTLRSAGPIALSRDALYFAAREGVMRCSPGAACARMKAFGRSGFVNAFWVSSDSQLLGVVADGKLGISVNAGTNGIWRDLPADITEVTWLDGWLRAGRLTLFLGTREGLFESLDEGIHWRRRENGLPAAPVDGWLRGNAILLASLRQGGIYLSQDEGLDWTRVDEAAEKGRTTGLVQTAPGIVIVGSQSEGVLELELGPVK